MIFIFKKKHQLQDAWSLYDVKCILVKPHSWFCCCFELDPPKIQVGFVSEKILDLSQ